MVVAAAVPGTRFTIDDLERFPDDGKRRELVDGQIVEWEVPNVQHNFVLSRIFHLLTLFVEQHGLGTVLSGDTMVRVLCSQHDARGADIAFFGRGNFPTDTRAAATMTVPDLVVEVISPSDGAGEVQEKVRDWLRTGVRLLWYVNPETGTTTVYRGSYAGYVDATETLTGDEVVPGFTVRMLDVMNMLEARQAKSK